MNPPRAVLSVDFEHFSHLPAYRNAAGTLSDSEVGSEAIDFLLDCFAEHGAESTFFFVSDIAENHPEIAARVADAGHEIGSHTQSHVHLSTVSEEKRRTELVSSRETLEEVTGERVSGFRAPSFDIPSEHFEEVNAAGYEYDSSVIPCRKIPGWYGGEYDAHRPVSATEIHPNAPSGLSELPVSVMPGLRLPLTGAWIRFFGYRYTLLGMKLLARRGVAPVLYVHPWEFVDLPDVDGVPTRVYWRTGSWMQRAVSRLLAQPFEFTTGRVLVS